MPRAIWSGAISFGLVSVPVKLFAAVAPKTVRFHQLHAADHVRIQQKRVCPADGAEVPYEEIVKGYEIAPDQYVVLEPEELAALSPGRGRTIEIEDFVSLSDIDPIFYDHPYYLTAADGGAKPYRLLLEAMRDTERVGIARFVLRSKEHVVAIRPIGPVLGLATMVFADEIVSPDRLDGAGEEVSTTKKELDIAKQLIESLSGTFEPERYTDTYREQVLTLIERKAKGQEIAVQPAAEPPKLAGADLIGALQASLDEVRRRTGAGPKKPPRKKAAGPAKTTRKGASPKGKSGSRSG